MFMQTNCLVAIYSWLPVLRWATGTLLGKLCSCPLLLPSFLLPGHCKHEQCSPAIPFAVPFLPWSNLTLDLNLCNPWALINLSSFKLWLSVLYLGNGKMTHNPVATHGPTKSLLRTKHISSNHIIQKIAKILVAPFQEHYSKMKILLCGTLEG